MSKINNYKRLPHGKHHPSVSKSVIDLHFKITYYIGDKLNSEFTNFICSTGINNYIKYGPALCMLKFMTKQFKFILQLFS